MTDNSTQYLPMLDGEEVWRPVDSKIESVYMPIALRDDAVSTVKRVIELLIVQWAVDYGHLLDRVNDVMLVFIVFMMLTIVSSFVKYKCEDWKRRLEIHKKAYSSERHIIEENYRQKMTNEERETEEEEEPHMMPSFDTITPTTVKSSSPEKKVRQKFLELLVTAQIEEEPSGIVSVEYFLELASYVVHLAELFIAFLLMKIIQDRVDDSGSAGSNRVLRMVKPIIMILIIYAEFTMSGYRRSFYG